MDETFTAHASRQAWDTEIQDNVDRRPLLIASHSGAYSSFYFDIDAKHTASLCNNSFSVPIVAIASPSYKDLTPFLAIPEGKPAHSSRVRNHESWKANRRPRQACIPRGMDGYWLRLQQRGFTRPHSGCAQRCIQGSIGRPKTGPCRDVRVPSGRVDHPRFWLSGTLWCPGTRMATAAWSNPHAHPSGSGQRRERCFQPVPPTSW